MDEDGCGLYILHGSLCSTVRSAHVCNRTYLLYASVRAGWRSFIKLMCWTDEMKSGKLPVYVSCVASKVQTAAHESLSKSELTRLQLCWAV